MSTARRPAPPTLLAGRAETRRDGILAAAVQLFRERGFHGAGIDDIGAAAGIAGPSVYRHFESKDALLVAVFDAVIEHLLAAADGIVAEADSPRDALAELVDFHLDFALDNAGLIVVYEQEERNVAEPDRRRVRRRQRSYVERWMEPLGRVLRGADAAELRTRVHAAVGLIHSVAHYRVALPRSELHAVVRAMAMAAMTAAESR